jgi:hypothetical protein
MPYFRLQLAVTDEFCSARRSNLMGRASSFTANLRHGGTRMSGTRVVVGTRKGAFILTSDEARED